MDDLTKKTHLARGGIYLLGVATLALGITLNTKTQLGVAPVASVAYSSSRASGLSFSVCTFILYTLMLMIELVIKGEKRRRMDYLQLPFAFVFSLLLDVYDRLLLPIQAETMWQKLLLLLAAVTITGAGISMTVNTRLVASPPDALMHAIADKTKKDHGLVKNILDITCVSFAMVIDLLFNFLWCSVGFGTVLTMILVGRMVYLFNKLFLKRMLRASGLE